MGVYYRLIDDLVNKSRTLSRSQYKATSILTEQSCEFESEMFARNLIPDHHNMSIAMFDIRRFPYDILVYVFEQLDRKTLQAACLACSQLNELASSLLYREVTFLKMNRYPLLRDIPKPANRTPIMAFERRPQLRQAVRSLSISTQMLRYGRPQEVAQAPVLLAVTHIQLLPNITHLDIGTMRSNDFEATQYLLSLPYWPKLRSIALNTRALSLLKNELATIHSSLPPLHRMLLAFAYGSPPTGQDASFWSTSIQSLTLLSFSLDDTLRFAGQFPYLTFLDARQCYTWNNVTSDIVSAIGQLHRLEELYFQINVDGSEITCPRTGLKNLRILMFMYRCPKSNDKAGVVPELDSLVNTFAGDSELEVLKLQSVLPMRHMYQGDAFTGRLLTRHGHRLTRLSLADFRPSQAVYQRIFRCPQLKHLTIGANRTSLNTLPRLISSARQLEALCLAFPRNEVHFTLKSAQTLFNQSSHSLRKIRTRISGSVDWRNGMGGTLKTHWTANLWTGNDFERHIRTIQGPREASHPPIPKPWNEEEEYEDAE